MVASMTNTGKINLYNLKEERAVGSLVGLTTESFSLQWSKLRPGLIMSAAGTNVCIWDVNR